MIDYDALRKNGLLSKYLLRSGIRIVENPRVYQTVQVREHKKSRSMSDSYHNRVQKKWRKRFGTKQIPGCYLLNGDTLIAHPEIIKLIKETR